MFKPKHTKQILSDLKKLANKDFSNCHERILHQVQKFGNSKVFKYKADAKKYIPEALDQNNYNYLDDFKIVYKSEIKQYVISQNNTPNTDQYLLKSFLSNQRVIKNRHKKETLKYLKIILRREGSIDKLQEILASFDPNSETEFRYAFLFLNDLIITVNESFAIDKTEMEIQTKKETASLNIEQQNAILLNLKLKLKKLSESFVNAKAKAKTCISSFQAQISSENHMTNDNLFSESSKAVSIPKSAIFSIYTLQDNMTIDEFENPSGNELLTNQSDLNYLQLPQHTGLFLSEILTTPSSKNYGIMPDDEKEEEEEDDVQYGNVVSVELLTNSFKESDSNTDNNIDSIETSSHDSSIYINNELILLNSLIDESSEAIKQSINTNLWLIDNIIVKCRSITTLPLYSGQQTDLFLKEKSTKFVSSSSSFEAIKIDEDGSSLYKAVSMYLFGNQDYHIQLRLASIYVILYHVDYFRTLLVQTKSELIPHIGEVINEIAKSNSCSDNIFMVALSIVANRPLCYINANEKQAGFQIAHAFNFQLNIEPIKLILTNQHFVPLVANSQKETIFDFSSIVFQNYNQYIIADEFFN